MTQEEIIAGNKLIAEFMGLSYCEKYRYEGWYKNHEHNHRICDFDGLKYHTSWDWLMPVVEKIEKMNTTVVIEGIMCEIKTHSIGFDMTASDERSKILAVYYAVIEFIKWYNDNGR